MNGNSDVANYDQWTNIYQKESSVDFSKIEENIYKLGSKDYALEPTNRKGRYMLIY